MWKAWLSGLGVLVGCSSSSDFQVGGVTDDGSVLDSTTETLADAPAADADSSPDAGPGPGDTGSGEGSVDAPLDGGPCSPTELPPPSAVFASAASGNDGTGDGSALAPVKTIAKAVLLAKAKAAATIVLDQGTYAEAVLLQDLDSGLVIQGGWKRTAAVWSRVCDADARTLTLVQSPAAVGVFVMNAKKRSGLEHLMITTRAVADPGQSHFGVVVRGQSLFFLNDVAIYASKGGDGAATPATTPAASPSCDVVAGCTAIGLVGGPGAAGSVGVAGTFFLDGFDPGNGGNGGPGGNGSNGIPGGAGASSAVDECHWGCSGSAGCDAGKKTTVVGGTGKCGCGGVGGPGGKGGKGGAASVGVFVHGSLAVVDVTSSKILASDGGNGQSGAAGASPSTPTKGAKGDAKDCFNSGCTGDISACYYVGSPKSIGGGYAGGDGRAAGKGGDGGGGAGGPSHAIVTLVGATATVDAATKLGFGKGGTGGSGAKDGAAAARFSFP